MEQFPEVSIAGDKVDAKQCIVRGTGTAVFLAFLVAILASLVGIVATYGVLLLVFVFYPLFSWYFYKKSIALIHGSGVRVSDTQFPEVYRCVETFRERLGIKKPVDTYIIEANAANAAAVRYGKKNIVLITDDLIHGCLASGNPYALSFVIGHELAHITSIITAFSAHGCAAT